MTPTADNQASASATEQSKPSAEEPAGESGQSGKPPVGKVVAALVLVAIVECALAISVISALQAQVPRNMPFGVTAASPVVTNAESSKLSGFRVSFVNTLYANEAAATDAINQGKIYGAYITGPQSDTLLTAPAKSFGASTSIEALFGGAAAQLHRPLTVKQVKPLPAGKDPVGAVTELLVLPVIVGGLLAAILVFQSTGKAAEKWRVGILVAYGVFGALLVDLIAGPCIGAYAGDRFWPMFLCLWLATTTVALVTAALLALFRGITGILLAVVLFVVLGFPSSGAAGVSLLPTYWQSIGAALPPRYIGTLINNVLYFSSNGIGTAITVLAVYAAVAMLAIAFLGRLLPRLQAAGGPAKAGRARSSLTVRIVAGVFLVAVLEQCLFASNYLSSSHNPVAHNLPFGVTGNSSLTSEVEKNLSLDVKHYSDEAAAKRAIDHAEIYGALISNGQTNTLLTVPTASDLAPLELEVHFGEAAKAQGQQLTVQSYAPTPLPSGDTSGIVISLILTPLLVGGYMAATVLRAVTGAAAQRWRGMVLFGYAVIAALLVDVIAGPWLNSFPGDKFWIMWPILVLITLVVALFAVVMQRLFGAAGTLLTVIVIILFGKPSAGGASGVHFLPGFWNTIGPFLPPRSAETLLRNTVYFNGHGTTQSLIILLAFLVVLAVIVGLLDWYRRPSPELPVSRKMEAEAAAAATPAGVAA